MRRSAAFSSLHITSQKNPIFALGTVCLTR
jgi:hypothetical protein